MPAPPPCARKGARRVSEFLRPALQSLEPYVPGEQPQDRRYIKLNTNESPFPPSPRVLEALNREAVERLNLYPDPCNRRLLSAIAQEYSLRNENVFVGNGSDEVLAFAFMAFGRADQEVVFPEVSYGFYPVFARLYGLPARQVPLNPDWTLPVEPFCGAGGMVAIANPNAPTSLAAPLEALERIVASNPTHVVLVDEAYIDFGGESCLPLLARYPNLLIVRTYSKSRSLAGGRLGYALANAPLIDDLNRVKNSFHPYSVDRLTEAAGVAAMEDKAYFDDTVARVVTIRDQTAARLRALGFEVPQSATNFLFVRHPALAGEDVYQTLRRGGVLARYFGGKLADYVRISVGDERDMQTVCRILATRLEERG